MAEIHPIPALPNPRRPVLDTGLGYSCSTSAREIIKLREEYKRRTGEHHSTRHFYGTLLTYGDLPFRQIRRLMFRD